MPIKRCWGIILDPIRCPQVATVVVLNLDGSTHKKLCCGCLWSFVKNNKDGFENFRFAEAFNVREKD